MSFIAKHLPYPQNNVPADKVIQRHINKARIPKIAEYLVKYYDDYVLPPIIASIDGEIEWEPLSADSENMQVGILKIPDSADLIINDGQHRCAAIQHALQKRPELKYETLGVIFYIDRGVKRARQMFSDLNGHPVRTNQNINATFDSRQYLPQLTKRVIENSALLRGPVLSYSHPVAQSAHLEFSLLVHSLSQTACYSMALSLRILRLMLPFAHATGRCWRKTFPRLRS